MYAVEPAQVRANAEKLTAQQILGRLMQLVTGPEWVTLSGGNPAMLKLGPVVDVLQEAGYRVAVETQGSKWRDWLASVDCLTVSPKPPSSGMSRETEEQLPSFMGNVAAERGLRSNDCLKVVVFDDTDYEWARAVLLEYSSWPAFISVGTNPVGLWGSEVVATPSLRATIEGISDRYRWLCEKVAADFALRHVRVLPQLHVIAFGHARGV